MDGAASHLFALILQETQNGELVAIVAHFQNADYRGGLDELYNVA